MDNLSTAERVTNIIKSMPEGEIFSINDFYDEGLANTIKSILFRLEQKNEISRLIDGLYTRPKYSKLLKEYSYPSANALAYKIAEKFSWNICPSEDNALNIIGLSTQVVNEYIFVSDGPYRTYNYRGRKVRFKNTSNRYISEYSKDLSLLIQAIRALGNNNITKGQIIKLAQFSKKHVKEDLSTDTKKLPVWIKNVLYQIDKELKQDE